MSTVSTSDVFYDSADFDITRNPYPTFKRMRDEAPLYYNEERDFYAVSRFDDVAGVLSNNKTFINKYGGTIDLIKSGIEIPPGTVLFEDEPAHGIHRSLLARAFFTPKNVAALDGQIRQFCIDVLDQLEPGGFDFAKDIGEIVPMRVIGMLLGLSTEQQDELHEAMEDYAAARRQPRPPLRHRPPHRLRQVAQGQPLQRRRHEAAELGVRRRARRAAHA